MVCALAFFILTGSGHANLLGGLHWRLIGPFRGGRALAVTGVPGTPEKFYFGAVGGGVWMSENAGRTWVPVFDKEPVASIGAIAVAPSDPNVLYVGSGEADMRADIQQGDGMYKSTDAGKTWTNIGLADTRQIGKVLVDPRDPNVVYVAALGHQYGPNEQRGVFKSTDGGKTWSKSLYKGPDVGAIDLAMDPDDPGTLFATLWNTRRPPWSVYPPSMGPGSGLFKTTDAGQSWTQVKGDGFPAQTGRIGVTISPADHNRVYAVVDSPKPTEGGVYRSDDGGYNWTHSDGENRIWGRGWYFCGITADPKNPDEVYVMNTSAYRSTDGGHSFTPFKGAPGGDDYHTLWIDPDDANRLILGSDQGVVISVDHGATWSSWYNQPIGQFYHVVTDNRFPYWVYGSQQDSGAMALPSRTIHSGISAIDFRPIDAGGESGTIAPDPEHPGLLYSSTGSRELLDTAWVQAIDPTLEHNDTHWRSNWTMPIIASPNEKGVFYTSHQRIFRTADGGASWKLISPDLTRKISTAPPNLDPATAADGAELPRRGVVYWIAPSPVASGVIWAGTDDGLVWLTGDEGVHWRNVTPPQLTPWSKVGIVDASPFDAATATIAVDRHRLDDNRPYIYRTHDRGKHWKLVVDGLPADSWVNVAREDPKCPQLLYAGTDRGVYYSPDDGSHWQSMQLNLPPASVRDIVFGGNDIVVGTHGRAIWILDDPTPLRQASGQGLKLYRPSRACAFQRAGVWGFGANDEGTPFPPEEPQGENPAWGATFDYSLPSAAPQVVLTVRDSSGKLVRRLSSSDRPARIRRRQLDIPAYWIKPTPTLGTAPGGHRFAWNMRFGADDGPIVPPGQYSLTLTALGLSQTQPLAIVRDPRLRCTDSDLRAQFDFILAVDSETTGVRAAIAKARTAIEHDSKSSARLRALIGAAPYGATGPDGATFRDTSSLSYIAGALGSVRRGSESALGAPLLGYLRAFKALRHKAHEAEAKVKRLTG